MVREMRVLRILHICLSSNGVKICTNLDDLDFTLASLEGRYRERETDMLSRSKDDIVCELTGASFQ